MWNISIMLADRLVVVGCWWCSESGGGVFYCTRHIEFRHFKNIQNLHFYICLFLHFDLLIFWSFPAALVWIRKSNQVLFSHCEQNSFFSSKVARKWAANIYESNLSNSGYTTEIRGLGLGRQAWKSS